MADLPTVGGEGGSSWNDGAQDGVKQIIVVYGTVIDSIRIEYVKDGRPMWGVKHGGRGGPNTSKVELDFPNEYLKSVSCHYTKFRNVEVIYSLKFHSNRRSFGPFGTEKGSYLTFPFSDAKILGFYGKSGSLLDAIGVHVEYITNPNPFKSIGPFGGQGGTRWDDGTHTAIREIKIWSASVIDSIQILYYKDGSSTLSPKHGRSSGGSLQTVELDCSNEYLILISGHYGIFRGHTVIHSLTFQSNRTKYGPFGKKNGSPFSISSNGGKIVGFYGKSGTFIDSIGAYVQAISHR